MTQARGESALPDADGGEETAGRRDDGRLPDLDLSDLIGSDRQAVTLHGKRVELLRPAELSVADMHKVQRLWRERNRLVELCGFLGETSAKAWEAQRERAVEDGPAAAAAVKRARKALRNRNPKAAGEALDVALEALKAVDWSEPPAGTFERIDEITGDLCKAITPGPAETVWNAWPPAAQLELINAFFALFYAMTIERRRLLFPDTDGEAGET